MLFDCLAVGCGGFIGSVLRYLAGCVVRNVSSFPIVTLGVNVMGSFAIALFAGLCSTTIPDGRLGLFLQVGLCGGFTTFSAFSLETMQMIERGEIAVAILYVFFSLVLCVMACLMGTAAAKVMQ